MVLIDFIQIGLPTFTWKAAVEYTGVIFEYLTDDAFRLLLGRKKLARRVIIMLG